MELKQTVYRYVRICIFVSPNRPSFFFFFSSSQHTPNNNFHPFLASRQYTIMVASAVIFSLFLTRLKYIYFQSSKRPLFSFEYISHILPTIKYILIVCVCVCALNVCIYCFSSFHFVSFFFLFESAIDLSYAIWMINSLTPFDRVKIEDWEKKREREGIK